ncbi:hypothetical protein VNO78_25979 [Psophocarpus tetragonolobus]|uniref:Uncharacterized protein n=1 Tax=Psophocarpus tetragonolobus TaxID=3891 RepID=A0AAN9SAN9_PSOTE
MQVKGGNGGKGEEESWLQDTGCDFGDPEHASRDLPKEQTARCQSATRVARGLCDHHSASGQCQEDPAVGDGKGPRGANLAVGGSLDQETGRASRDLRRDPRGMALGQSGRRQSVSWEEHGTATRGVCSSRPGCLDLCVSGQRGDQPTVGEGTSTRGANRGIGDGPCMILGRDEQLSNLAGVRCALGLT